jgi:ribosomal protein S18 acetylase RimI-like enzyme
MTVATQLEILDLRHFSARQLRPLLEREAQVWKKRLRWDYQKSTDLLLEYLDSRILPGFVALNRGRLCGFTFCVYEGHKAVIGDAFAFTENTGSSIPIANTLLHHLIQMLQHTPNIDRIESQLLLYDVGAIDETFASAGFSMFPRRFLELDLKENVSTRAQNIAVHEDVELSPWSATDFQAAAELIYTAYSGHIDAKVNDQYRSLHGSLRFLHNIVRFPGCGVFAGQASWVLRERSTGTMIGMVLCSDVGEEVMHVTQICISPKQRRRGLGEWLMCHCLTHLADTGSKAVTLTVTEANLAAMELYQRLGFSTRQRFEAMIFEATPR